MVGNVCSYFKPNHSANYRVFNFSEAFFAVFFAPVFSWRSRSTVILGADRQTLRDGSSEFIREQNHDSSPKN